LNAATAAAYDVAAAVGAACRDPHELVRRQALALLANLLMKDYVKWRGTLFHR
jgi:condensin-2 complex subunit D3